MVARVSSGSRAGPGSGGATFRGPGPAPRAAAAPGGPAPQAPLWVVGGDSCSLGVGMPARRPLCIWAFVPERAPAASLPAHPCHSGWPLAARCALKRPCRVPGWLPFLRMGPMSVLGEVPVALGFKGFLGYKISRTAVAAISLSAPAPESRTGSEPQCRFCLRSSGEGAGLVLALLLPNLVTVGSVRSCEVRFLRFLFSATFLFKSVMSLVFVLHL